MNKYIIRNCPCLFNSYYASGKTVRFECNDGNHDDKLCRDVTDCLLKRIVEKCQKEINADMYKANAYYAMGKVAVAEKILELLDIEEVE